MKPIIVSIVLVAFLTTGACSPSVEPAPAASTDEGQSGAVAPLDSATITDVTTEDKLTIVMTELSPLRADLTNASAQAAKLVGSKVKAGQLAVGSDHIAIGVTKGTDIVLSVKYPASVLAKFDYKAGTDAQILEASEDVTFGEKGAIDAQAWCMAFAADAPKFCKTAE